MGPSATKYQYKKYSVIVGSDGSIKVKHGDWLSKYSAAIYGNFWQTDAFRRKDRSGNYIPVHNPDRIYAGETVYHMPTIWGARYELSGVVSTAPSISEIEKKKRIVEHFKKEHPEAAEIAEKIALGGHVATEIAEILETLGLLSEGWGEFASGAGVVLFPIHATLDVFDSLETTVKYIGWRAQSYGITAWAFGDPPPPLPQWLRVGDATTRPNVMWQRAWTEGVAEVMKALDQIVQKKKVKKEDVQVIFQAIGDNDRQEFAMKIMTERAEKVSGWPHSPYEARMFWEPQPIYPSQ